MPKPILIIKITSNMAYSNQTIDDIESKVNEKIKNEYHILIVNIFGSINNVEFDVFYEKDFTEIKYDELKEIIKKYWL